MTEPIYLVYPNAKWEGCLTAVCRGDGAVERLKKLEQDQSLRRFRIRATIADVVPLIGELPELLGQRPFRRVIMNEDPLQIYVHHGGWNAIYYTLVGDGSADHFLSYVEVTVETKFPRSALQLGRTAISRLLDSESVVWQLPAVIARLDLLTSDSDEVVVSEIILPYTTALSMGPLGGLHQSPLFTPWLSILREAITASSPYWRLLCAWRVYDGIQFMRGRIKQECERLGVPATLPKDPEVSLDTLREAGLPEEFTKGIKKTSHLFNKFQKMRDGVAHFLLKEGTHTYFSDGSLYSEYSLASTVLLHAANQAVKELHQFYASAIESKTRIGTMLPERKHADKFIVRDPAFSTPLSAKDFAGP